MKRFLFFTLLLAFFFNVSAQPFTPGNLVVVRFGDGSTVLNANATKTFLDEYTPAGVLVRSIAMPTSVSGLNKRLTNSGTAISEGALSLSADGRYLFLAGYNAAVGTATPHLAAATTINRVVGRVDLSGNINTATVISDGYTGDGATLGNIKSAVSDNGTNIWTSGSSVFGGDGAVRYTTLGNTGSTTQISVSTYTANTRWLGIANNQLYVSYSGFVNMVGTGLPATGGQPLWGPSGMGSGSPFGFLLFDTDPGIPGPDLMYVTSQSSTNPYLSKWFLDTSFGGIWKPKGRISINAQLEGMTGFRNCMGGVDVYVTRAATSTDGANEIRFFRDSSPPEANISNDGGDFTAAGVSTLIVTAPSTPNPVSFRGIAMVPLNGYNVTGATSIPAGTYNTITVRSGGTATLTGNISIADKVIVESGGTLITGNYTISGFNGTNGGEFFLRPGGKLKIGSPQGISMAAATGNIQTCHRDYSPGANYEYNGTTIQITGDGLPDTLTATLKINNITGIGTPGVTLSQNTTVKGVLDLTAGKLTSSISGLLNIADNATAINYSTVTNNSFVVGPMKKTGDDDFIFPVGEGAEMHTITLVKVSGDAVTDEFQVQYFKANPRSLFPGPEAPGTDHMSVLEYWMVNRNVGGASLIKKIKLQATTYTDATDLTRLVIVNNPTGSAWQNDGRLASSGAFTGTVTSNDVTSFGPFTFASLDPYPTNPLPIKLISFDASKLTNTRSSINWELAACCSSAAKFEIQKANADKKFTTIGAIGGSETNKLYNYIDNGLKNGVNYYRLKMIDEDGKITYSRTVAVMNGVNGLLLTSLIPTIVTNNTSLTVASSSQQKLDIIIVDMQGQVVLKRNYTFAAGNTNIELSLSTLSAGVYQLTGISAEGKTNTIRFIKQ